MSEQYSKYLPVLVALLVMRFVWMPVFEARGELESELRTKQSQLSKAQNVIDNADNFKAQLELLQKNQQLLEKQFYRAPSEAEFRLILQSQLEQIAKANDVTLSNLRWFDGLDADGLSWQQLEFNIEGGLDQISGLHLKLEDGDKWLSIERIQLRSPARKKSWTLQGKFRVSIPVKLGEFNANA